jgi:hypothetical protein
MALSGSMVEPPRLLANLWHPRGLQCVCYRPWRETAFSEQADAAKR